MIVRNALRSSTFRMTTGALLLAALAACEAVTGGRPHRTDANARPADAAWPETVPEKSDYTRTSTVAEVAAFLEEVTARSPRLALTSMGRSSEDRDLMLVIAASDGPLDLDRCAADPRPKIVINANIHAGEVEAKEAVQAVIREIAAGGHEDLLDGQILVFVPVYNPDGNEALSRRSRPEQAGPPEVGRRTNAQGLDLNRDFTKLEAPESRALVALLDRLDPILFIDGHTTDGSYHGFDLTYAGPLSPATDSELLRYSEMTFLPALRARMMDLGFRTFDYGNFEGEWSPPRREQRWETYDHLPRYGTNYVGLRNRLSLLSEAYAHASFRRRIDATRALILTALGLIREDRDRLAALGRAADDRTRLLAGTAALPLDGRLASIGTVPLPASSVRRKKDGPSGAVWLEATGALRWIETEAFVRFDPLDPIAVPRGWAVLAAPEAVPAVLARHGIRSFRLDEAATVAATSFVVHSVQPERAKFQGHLRRALAGEFASERCELPAGTLVVPAEQRLARLALLLLEARSPDGFASWDLLPPVRGRDGRLRHAVVRLEEIPAGPRADASANRSR